MVKTASTMLELGTAAPDFVLPDTSGTVVDRHYPEVSLADFGDASALVVAFICNHCPFVVHIREALAEFGREYQARDVAMVAISSNDVETHPADGPEQMADEAAGAGYTFPYLYDATQAVAKAYHAACTPDFFVFDGNQHLVYRGQFDDSRPESGIPVTGADLRAACDAVLAGETVTADQRPSIGCNIKWTDGAAPSYFTGEPAV